MSDAIYIPTCFEQDNNQIITYSGFANKQIDIFYYI